jgi:opacity protein-like surface antigen
MVVLYAGDKKIQKAEVPVVPIVPIVQKQIYNLYVGLYSGWMRLKDQYSKEYFETIPVGFQIGYDINDYLSVESRYTRDTSKVSYKRGYTSNPNNNDFDTTFSNLALFVKPKYKYKNYHLYTLLGYGEVSLSNIKGSDRIEDGFEWGVGMSYNITKNINCFVDYISIYHDKGFDKRAKDRLVTVDNVSLGVSYAF